MREALFSIDLLGDHTFSGYTNNQFWNGWACPYFPFEQAQRLSAVWRDHGWNAGYDGERDAFTFAAAGGLTIEYEQGSEEYAGVEADGRKLYPIGAGAWIWDEVTGE